MFPYLQVVCGIIMVVMGSVACIEEKGAVTNLGLGVFAGLATVFASGTNYSLENNEFLFTGIIY